MMSLHVTRRTCTLGLTLIVYFGVWESLLTSFMKNDFSNAALPYTEYPLRMLKFEIRAEITEYDANVRCGACTKRCPCGSLQMS